MNVIAIVVAAVIALIALLAVIPRVRRVVRDSVAPALIESVNSLRVLADDPAKMVVLIVGAVLTTGPAGSS